MNEEPGNDDELPPKGNATPPPTLPFPADAPELEPEAAGSWIRRLARRLFSR